MLCTYFVFHSNIEFRCREGALSEVSSFAREFPMTKSHGKSRQKCVRVQMHLRTSDHILNATHRPLVELSSNANAQLKSLSQIIDALDVTMTNAEEAVGKVR